MTAYDIVEAGAELFDGDMGFDDAAAVVSGGLGILDVLLDPVAAIIGAPIEFLINWLVENVAIFKVPIDALLGDPEGIKANADRWTQIGSDTLNLGATHATTINLVSSWKGDGSVAYARVHEALGEFFEKTRASYEHFADLSVLCGVVIGAIREWLWGVLSDELVNWVTKLLYSLAASWFTFGTSVMAGVGYVLARIIALLKKFEEKLSGLLKALIKLAKDGNEIAQRMMKALRFLTKYADGLGAASDVLTGATASRA
ncbi:hypothetical protein [Enemella sp. A6]|uniref:hypothetical protein n=1 Tax=Enemella sp. A6 TaxID=3440152 RepID=UPI003EBD0AFA